MTIKSREIVKLSLQEESHLKEKYKEGYTFWEASLEYLQQKEEASRLLIEKKLKMEDLNHTLERLEGNLEKSVIKDKSLTNETLRKARLKELKHEDEEWERLSKTIMGLKEQIMVLELDVNIYTKMYNQALLAL